MECLVIELQRNASPLLFPPKHEPKQLENLKDKGTSNLLQERYFKKPKLETKKKKKKKLVP